MTRKNKKVIAEPKPITEQIENMDEVILACRDFRHAWATETPYYKIDMEGGVRNAIYVERVIACMRCDTKRIEFYRVFKTHLERISSHYKYAVGYQIKGVKKGDKIQSKVRHELYARAVSNVRIVND